MPTSTFFNLPESKRQKLLETAIAEFRQFPLAKASINRIIQNAGIPRGSFYMYFEDKLDLFQYLYRQLCTRMQHEMSQIFVQHNGDLFQGFLHLFDLLSPATDDSQRPEWISDLYHLFKINKGSFLSGFNDELGAHLERMRELLPYLNAESIRVTPEELLTIMELIASNCSWLIGQCHMNLLTPEAARVHFVASLRLLERTAKLGGLSSAAVPAYP